MDPPDVPASQSIDHAQLTAANCHALADVAAGRLIDSETMSRRLGGWHIARDMPETATLAASTRPHPCDVFWTETSVAACDGLRTLLAGFGAESEGRFRAALMAAMIRLIVDGPGCAGGIADLPCAPPLALRILVHDDRVFVLGVHSIGIIR